jgi:hypothetical protein
MQTLSLLRLLVALLAGPGAVLAAAGSGRPAPDFTVTDLAGRTHRLADYRGRIVVLEWTAPACPYVLRLYKSGSLPATQQAAAAAGAVWLQVNSSAMGDLDPGKTREWQRKNGVRADGYIRDVSGELGRRFGAQTTPHLFVIAADGTLAYQGAIDDQPGASLANTMAAHNHVKAALAALAAGRPVETAATRPYGCSVKYGGG